MGRIPTVVGVVAGAAVGFVVLRWILASYLLDVVDGGWVTVGCTAAWIVFLVAAAKGRDWIADVRDWRYDRRSTYPPSP